MWSVYTNTEVLLSSHLQTWLKHNNIGATWGGLLTTQFFCSLPTPLTFSADVCTVLWHFLSAVERQQDQSNGDEPLRHLKGTGGSCQCPEPWFACWGCRRVQIPGYHPQQSAVVLLQHWRNCHKTVKSYDLSKQYSFTFHISTFYLDFWYYC